MTPLSRPEPKADLAELTGKICRRLGVRRAVFGAISNGKVKISEFGEPAAGELLLNVSCVAKPMTAALVLKAVNDGALCLDQDVAEALGPGGGARGALAGVRIRQLLDHTHGLQSAFVQSVGKDASGMLDIDALDAYLGKNPPSAPPAQFYSYGNIGYLILGMILERRMGRPFTELLEAQLLRPLGISAITDHGLCPAGGRSALMSVGDMLKFISPQLGAAEQNHPAFGGPPARLRADLRPLPGWCPIDVGFTLGWRANGAGWYGASGRSPQNEVVSVKFNPDRGQALVAVTDGLQGFAAADQLMMGMFAHASASINAPRLLTAEALAGADLEAVTGDYQDTKTLIRVRRQGDGVVFSRYERAAPDMARELVSKHQILPGEQDFWLIKNPTAITDIFLQFLRMPGQDAFSHLWNGFGVLPRLDPA